MYNWIVQLQVVLELRGEYPNYSVFQITPIYLIYDTVLCKFVGTAYSYSTVDFIERIAQCSKHAKQKAIVYYLP